MCYRKIRIPVRKSSDFAPYVNSEEPVNGFYPCGYKWVYVPCGHCEDCLRQKQQDYFLRVKQEFVYNGHFAYFLTLTYDRFNLPKYKYFRPGVCSPDGEWVEKPLSLDISLWNKSHIQKFLKSINEKFLFKLGKSKGLVRTHNGKLTSEWLDFLSSTPRPFKYLCVCERGKADIYISDKGKKRRGTARPHYHLILLPQVEISDKDMYSLVKDNWPYGSIYNIRVGDDGKELRDINQSIQYVTKYATKSGDFSYKGVQLKDILFSSHKDELTYLPFLLTSHGFGSKWLSEVTKDMDYFINHIMKDGISYTSHSGLYHLNISPYFSNKVFKSYKKGLRLVKKYDCHSHIHLDEDSGIPIFSETWETSDFDLVKCRIQGNNLYGEQYKANTLHFKGEFYCHLVKTLRKDISLLISAANLSYSPLFNSSLDEFISLLYSVDLDEFYLYIVQSQGIVDSCNDFELLFDYLDKYSSTLKQFKFLKHESVYEANLETAMRNNPELFKPTLL